MYLPQQDGHVLHSTSVGHVTVGGHSNEAGKKPTMSRDASRVAAAARTFGEVTTLTRSLRINVCRASRT
jgi:hypothetical protein